MHHAAERSVRIREVEGSNPFRSTTKSCEISYFTAFLQLIVHYREIRSGLHGKRLRDKNRVRPAAPLGPALPGAAAGTEDDVSKSGSTHLDQAA